MTRQQSQSAAGAQDASVDVLGGSSRRPTHLAQGDSWLMVDVGYRCGAEEPLTP